MVDCDDFTGRNNVVMCAVLVDARLNVNVALNRPSYQVSNLNGNYLASTANDDSHHMAINIPPYCAHTGLGETNSWWAVDLGVALHLRGVKFTNRGTLGMCAVSYVMIKCEPFLLTISLQRYV